MFPPFKVGDFVTVAGVTGTVGELGLVSPYTHANTYWQVYFDTNRAIVDVFTAAGTRYRVHRWRTRRRAARR
jgi:hypothetical protein